MFTWRRFSVWISPQDYDTIDQYLRLPDDMRAACRDVIAFSAAMVAARTRTPATDATPSELALVTPDSVPK